MKVPLENEGKGIGRVEVQLGFVLGPWGMLARSNASSEDHCKATTTLISLEMTEHANIMGTLQLSCDTVVILKDLPQTCPPLHDKRF